MPSFLLPVYNRVQPLVLPTQTLVRLDRSTGGPVTSGGLRSAAGRAAWETPAPRAAWTSRLLTRRAMMA